MRAFAIGLVFCLTVAPLPAWAQTPVAPAPATEAALSGLDQYIAKTIAKWRVPGVAVAVVKDGKAILTKGYGVRDPATGKPMTKDTVFPIASMSKAFTVFGAGLLVDRSKMSFDAPIVTYLPGLSFKDPAASSGLTLRDMLSHRSGLPRHDALWYHNAALTPAALATRMPYLQPSAPLRGKWQYNNNMFVLSGLAISKVSGKPFETALEEGIFVPLEMRRSTFSPDRARADDDHMGGVEVLNGKRINVPMFTNTEILNPAGGVYSTAEDIANWILVHLSDGQFKGRQIIQPTTLAEMHRTQMVTGQTVRDPEMVSTGYSLGWFTDIYRGRPMVSHGGNLPGISTMVAMIPDQKLGVAVFVNHGSSELRDALTRALLDRLLGASGKDWVGEALARKEAGEAAEITARKAKGGTRVAGTRPSHALTDYAGTYSDPGYGELSVRNAGQSLIAKYNDDSSAFAHWHYEVFDATTDDVQNLLLDSRLQFQMDLAGRISAIQMVMDPTVDPIIFKKLPEPKLSDPAYLRILAGTYELAGTPVTISLAGNKLTYLAKGGTPADLIPALGGEFTHSRRLDARIAFPTDAAGRPTAMTFTDSSGVYEAKRIR